MTEPSTPSIAADRLPWIWVRRPELIVLLGAVFAPPVIAWVDFLSFGLPSTLGNSDPANPVGPHQFFFWIKGWHYLNLLLVVLLTWTGWQIFADRPRLSWTKSDDPEREWFRLRLRPPTEETLVDRVRSVHPMLAVSWAALGTIYMILVALTGELEHLIPLTWRTIPEAFHVFVQYSTFHLPLDPDGYYRYNSLQLLSYAIVMFGLVPLISLTGLAISPLFRARFGWLARLFGNAEAARSIHYLAILGYFAFLAIHISFVVMYATWLNGNHVVLGTDETGLPGWLIGGVGISLIACVTFATRRFVRSRASVAS